MTTTPPVSTSVAALALAHTVRSETSAVDPNQAIRNALCLEASVVSQLAREDAEMQTIAVKVLNIPIVWNALISARITDSVFARKSRVRSGGA